MTITHHRSHLRFLKSAQHKLGSYLIVFYFIYIVIFNVFVTGYELIKLVFIWKAVDVREKSMDFIRVVS